MNADLFPDLAAERARLALARASRDRMIARLEAVDSEGAADEVTKDYIEVTVAEAGAERSGLRRPRRSTPVAAFALAL